jgi:hypothetical protein
MMTKLATISTFAPLAMIATCRHSAPDAASYSRFRWAGQIDPCIQPLCVGGHHERSNRLCGSGNATASFLSGKHQVLIGGRTA